MPKTPIDYSKAIIYSIVCKTDETLIYVGSTTEFTKRKNNHKKLCINEKNKGHHFQVYVMIRSNGGWGNFDMKPVKEFPCESKIQLIIEEERIRKEMNANLNTRRAYASLEERIEEIKEQRKQYRKDNSEYIAEQAKQYWKENAEHLSEQNKQYRKDNAEKIAEQDKERGKNTMNKINSRY